MKRYTFVVQIHPEGVSTLENLSTHERVQVASMDLIGPQIERWVEDLELSPARASTSPARTESAPGSAP